MFSAQDIREIFRTLPPDDGPGNSSRLGPSLLLSSTEQELVTTGYAFHKFEDILSTTESPQLSTADLSRALEIEPEAVLRFAKASPGLVLLSRENNIIPKAPRAALAHQLHEQLARELVSQTDFARDHNISPESMDALVGSVQESGSLQEGLTIMEESQKVFLASGAYRLSVSEAMHHLLNESLRENKPTELSPKLLPGSPPVWYISQLLNTILPESALVSEFHVIEGSDAIRCVPRESVRRKRDAKISALQAGEIPYLDLRALLDEFGETFKSIKDVQDHLATIPEVWVHDGTTAISTTWLNNFGNGCVDAVKVLGYADLTSKIESTFPSPCHPDLIAKLAHHISTAFPGEQMHAAGDYLVTSERYNSDRGLLLSSAKANAAHQWSTLCEKENPEKDLKFQLSDMFDFIPPDQEILRALSEDDREIRKAVEDAYWAEIERLEAENDGAFEVFWTSRIVSRVRNYHLGLQAIPDAKLQGQLSELLADYLRKEFIPASILKAKEQGLLKSRKTRKNIAKLESTLQPPSQPPHTNTNKSKSSEVVSDLPAILATLEKFNRKQNVHDLDAPALAKAKQVMVDDLARWMQKRSDGPTLFLTLVVVLLAKSCEGVVYATGKFAPKLMKLLKTELGAEKYSQLELWKDAVKKGALVGEDRERMKGWVREEDGERVEIGGGEGGGGGERDGLEV